MEAEGCTVDYVEMPGVIHGFLTLGKVFPESAQTLVLLARHLQTCLALPPA